MDVMSICNLFGLPREVVVEISISHMIEVSLAETVPEDLCAKL